MKRVGVVLAAFATTYSETPLVRCLGRSLFVRPQGRTVYGSPLYDHLGDEGLTLRPPTPGQRPRLEGRRRSA